MSEDQAPQTWSDTMVVAGWQEAPVFHQQRPAAVHAVRSALPTVHVRALQPDPYWGPGWPRRVWTNVQDANWIVFEWGDDGKQPVLGLVRDDRAGIVPMDAWRWKRHQASRPTNAPVLPQPPPGLRFVDFESHFAAEWLTAPASGPEPPANTIDGLDGGTAKLEAYAQGAEDEVMQFLDDRWPAAAGDSNWDALAEPLAWRVPDEDELAAIYAILRADAPANYSLPAPPELAAVRFAVRDTPFYDDALLVRLVDLRGERTRFAHFLADTRRRTQLALGYESRPIHKFNERLQAEGRLCIDARTCAEYVRFFCEFIEGEKGAFMVLRSADDMDWLDESRKAAHPTAAIKPLGLRFFSEPRRGGGEDNTNSDRYGPVVAVCMAYINHDRYVFVAALEVHAGGMIQMPFDNAIQDGDWPVAPTLFDDEFQFRLSAARDTGANPDIDGRHAGTSRRSARAGLPVVPSGLPTGPGELDPCRLRRHVEIHDAIDLRGHELDHALLVHGVVFWGRVDLRSATVKGDVDLTRCVFREGLLLDDAEIQGSLVLHRVSASKIGLRGVQVQGRLDMSEAKVEDWAHADGADVQGDLDARGLIARALSATGLNLRGNLRLGCRKGLRQSDLNNARLDGVDARNATVDGSVDIMQPGHLPGLTLDRPDRERSLSGALPSMDFTNATIKGSFNLRPNDNAPPSTDNASQPKGHELALGCLNLLLRGARIDGDLRLAAVLVVDSLQASHAEVGGNVEVLGVWALGSAKFDDMRVAGWMVIAPYTSPVQDGARNLPLASRFDNGLDLALSRVTRLALRGIDCRGDLDLWAVRSESMVRLETCDDLPFRVRANAPLAKEHDGNLNAYGLSTLQFNLDGVDVEGDINLKGVDLLELLCVPALLHRPGVRDDASLERKPLLLPRCALFKMANARVRGNVELACLQVSGAHSMGERGLSILDSEVDGKLLLTQSGRIDRLFQVARHGLSDKPDCPVPLHGQLVSAIAGPVAINRCTFGAQLDLTGVQVDEEINLEDSRLHGDLVIQAEAPCAHATSLNLRKLYCANDVNLTGLVLGDASTTTDEWLLTASHAEITADLHLCRHQGARWTRAQIYGGIDFRFARLTHLVVHSDIVARQGAQLDLRHANIARMEIPRNKFDKISLPKTRLRGATIAFWDPDYDYDTDDLHELYRELLGSDADDSPEVAAALERQLRQDGLTAVAESVYRFGYDRQFVAEVRPRYQPLQALSRRVTAVGASVGLANVLKPIGAGWSKTKRWGRMVRHGVFKLSLGFGTQIYRLILALVLVGVLALPITLSGSNFEASLSALAVPRDRSAPAAVIPCAPNNGATLPVVKGSTPTLCEWGHAEALQVLLKNWLPMLPLHARDDWQPRGDGRTAWSWHGAEACKQGDAATVLDGCLPLSPEDWLNTLQLLCWMGWPLLLTMFVRRVLRH